MSYNKTNWTDRSVESPHRYQMTQNEDGTVTLIPVPGIIYNEGTLINANNMNKIEQGVYDVAQEIINVQQQIPQNIITGEEVATNEYLDGNRIYMKKINCGALSSAELTVSHGITDYSKVWVDTSNSYAIGTDGNVVPIPYANSDNISYSISIFIDTSAKTIRIRSVSQRTSQTYVTLKYTKN